MNSISSKAGMESVYLTAKKVYGNLLTVKQGVTRLRATLDSSEASIKMYFNIYTCMRKGKVYKMGTSEGFTRYLLESILRDEGEDAFLLALSAAKSNSVYRESVNNAQPGIKKACLDAIATSGLSIDYEHIEVDSSVVQQSTVAPAGEVVPSTSLSQEDREKLISCINLPNMEFASTLMSIAERYRIFNEIDISLLCDRQKSRELFCSDYAYLKEIDTASDLSAQLKSTDGRNRYYGTTYVLNSKTYVVTSQLYGLAQNSNRKNNRTPFWEWVLRKCNIENPISEWWPSLEEYNPGISKENWLELLNASEILGENIHNMLAGMYAQGGSTTCAQLAELYGKTASHYVMTVVHAAENVVKATNCPIMQDKEDSKYWPIFFVGRNEPKTDRFIWKIRDELYAALTEHGIDKYLKQENAQGGEKEMTIKEKVEAIKSYIISKGFNYEGSMIENFYLSLKSKPFLILAGTSGTGKTRLVRLFAEAINAECKLVSVRPDWSDSSDLFGHVDLNQKFVEGAVIQFIKQAELNPSKPYFLCLDEMNLARVEYYMSDFLSAIETRRHENGTIVTDPIDVNYGNDSAAAGRYGKLILPGNLYIIGTVNMDETTFPFSKKVLDRANTIEFSYVDLLSMPSFSSITADKITATNAFLVSKYITLNDCDIVDKEYISGVCTTLSRINRILEFANAHIGYRVRDEIIFYMLNNRAAALLDDKVALDNQIMQKILPRVQGSSESIKTMLGELLKICESEKYETSAKKINFMIKRYEEDGFTSYWL